MLVEKMANTGKIAMDHVRNRLTKMGETFEKGREGWDFTIKNKDGTETPIEVKGIVETNRFVLLSDYNTAYKGPEGLPDKWQMWIVIASKEGEVRKLLRLTKQEVIERTRGIKGNPYRTWQVNWSVEDLKSNSDRSP
jgi:hypothetical protein